MTSADVTAYIAGRQTDTIVTRKPHTQDDGTGVPAVTKPVSKGQINRELITLKRISSLAVESGKLAMKPKIKLLAECAPCAGFFELEQFASECRHLPEETWGDSARRRDHEERRGARVSDD